MCIYFVAALDSQTVAHILPDSSRLTQTRANLSQTRRDLPRCAKTHPNFPRFARVARDCHSHRPFQTRPDAPTLSQTRPGSPWIPQTRPDSTRLSQTGSDSPRLATYHPPRLAQTCTEPTILDSPTSKQRLRLNQTRLPRHALTRPIWVSKGSLCKTTHFWYLSALCMFLLPETYGWRYGGLEESMSLWSK